MNEERAVPDAKSASVGKHEHLYECASCGHMYLAKVSQCDCMPDVQQFNEWIAYPKQASAPAQPAAHDQGEVQKLRDECEYLANENIELKLLIKNMRQQFSTSTGQEAAHVSVPRELLQDLRDLAQDAVDHHRQAYAGYKLERQANMDQVIANADALLNWVEE